MNKDWKQIINEYQEFAHDLMTKNTEGRPSSDLWVFDWLQKNYKVPEAKPVAITKENMVRWATDVVNSIPDKIKIEAFRSITGTEKGKFKAIIIIAETEELDIELMSRIESRPTIE